MVAIAFVTMAIGVNARTAFSLLFPPILDEFGWSRGTVAAIFSIGFIVSTILTPIAGVLMDRYGPRLVIPLGAVLVSFGLATAPFSSQPWHFYLTLGVLVVGGSIFMTYMGHVLFLPNWFDRRRGLAIGLAFSGVGVGSITLFPWLQSSIQTDGWRESCWILAAIVLVVLVPLNFLFQRRRPEDMGLVPDGDTAPKGRTQQMKKDASGAVVKGRPGDRIVDHAWAATEWTLWRAMCTRRFWWLMLAFNTSLYAWYAVQVHQTRYLIDVGISAEVPSYFHSGRNLACTSSCERTSPSCTALMPSSIFDFT